MGFAYIQSFQFWVVHTYCLYKAQSKAQIWMEEEEEREKKDMAVLAAAAAVLAAARERRYARIC